MNNLIPSVTNYSEIVVSSIDASYIQLTKVGFLSRERCVAYLGLAAVYCRGPFSCSADRHLIILLLITKSLGSRLNAVFHFIFVQLFKIYPGYYYILTRQNGPLLLMSLLFFTGLFWSVFVNSISNEKDLL